jgi:REP element-mobilizing transposase RayT
MPRMGRIVLPYYPHHIIQRGHNRRVVFAEPRDLERYLGTLAEFKADRRKRYGIQMSCELNKSVPFSW